MKETSLKSNFLYQGLYQLLILGIPLILSPYLTRTLGAENLGAYTYTNSIAYYFVIFAMLGINRHGQRSVASSKNEYELRKNFWGIYVVHVIFSIVALVAYLIFSFYLCSSNKTLFIIQGLYVMSALFDITWFFYGIEKFKSVVIKNTFVKVIELILIFSFVKSNLDLTKYTLIICGTGLLGQIIMIPQMLSIAKPIKISLSDCTKHIKPLLILSISIVAVSLYTVFDKTLLGIMLDMKNVSYYEYANRLISIPKTLLSVITTVLFPKVCKLAEKGKEGDLKKLFNTSFFFTGIIGMCFTAVLIGVSKSFAPWYYGNSFRTTGDVMIVMSAVVLIVSLGDLIRTQLMISRGKDNQFILCVVVNAIVNIIFSILLIRVIGIYGAVIGSIISETCGLILESIFCRKDIEFKHTFIALVPFIFIGLLASFIALIVGNYIKVSLLKICFQFLIILIIYIPFSLLYIYLFNKDYYIMIKKIILKGKAK